MAHKFRHRKIRATATKLPPFGQVLCILCKSFHPVQVCSLVKLFMGWESRQAEEVTHWVVEGGMLKQVSFVKQSTYPTFRSGYTCPSCFPDIARKSVTRYKNKEGKQYDFFLAEIIRTPTTRSKEEERKALEKQANRILREGKGLLVENRRRVEEELPPAPAT